MPKLARRKTGRVQSIAERSLDMYCRFAFWLQQGLRDSDDPDSSPAAHGWMLTSECPDGKAHGNKVTITLSQVSNEQHTARIEVENSRTLDANKATVEVYAVRRRRSHQSTEDTLEAVPPQICERNPPPPVTLTGKSATPDAVVNTVADVIKWLSGAMCCGAVVGSELPPNLGSSDGTVLYPWHGNARYRYLMHPDGRWRQFSLSCEGWKTPWQHACEKCKQASDNTSRGVKRTQPDTGFDSWQGPTGTL